PRPPAPRGGAAAPVLQASRAPSTVEGQARFRRRRKPAARITPVVAAGGSRHVWPDGNPRPRPFGSQGMNIVVCVKQIPDPAMPGQLDPGSKTLKREGK